MDAILVRWHKNVYVIMHYCRTVKSTFVFHKQGLHSEIYTLYFLGILPVSKYYRYVFEITVNNTVHWRYVSFGIRNSGY